MHNKITQIKMALNAIILGKEAQVTLSLACLFAKGHLLLEDLPGMGKTTLAHSLAKVLGLSYQRLQFTSDLLPGDIIGGEIFDPATQAFRLHHGPIFTELLLADEINRTTPKSQSALLEAMEERQVSIGRKSYRLPEHFFVIATQNPNTAGSGTYPLPDSQMDRFLMTLSLGYPTLEAERRILKGDTHRGKVAALPTLLTREGLSLIQKQVLAVSASDALLDYILRLVFATRTEARFAVGISPRGSTALLRAAQAYALVNGRDYVVPEDVKAVLPSVFEHRLRHSGHNSQDAVQWLLDHIPTLV
ncbi:MoxR family ATPase [Wohlfahrtiimonas sp. G9077]|uniref:AAA family ATPase n=1 Tax=Wohlfahrtiimonas sp. G9077 TaxID=1980118 RepID=UPI000B98B1DD|nr:MoxR family ATPase [Wohlfahrtiimonas sp. G9077]OYQ75266.1 AAA family ATPase [Wohlfahrtiimonas sp. G9077]